MKKFSEIIKSIEEGKKEMEILPTGLTSMDDHLEGGFLKKELVVLGAPTGRGKSLVGGTMFYNIASKGFKSAYFSLEISNEMIGSRLLGAKSNISPIRIMIKTLAEKEIARAFDAQTDISVYEEFMYFYDDVYELSQIEKEIRENNYDFVVIDFIQNIFDKRTDEYERLSHVALSLQKLAKEASCCILALSQLSNQMSKSKDEDIVEYKGSGSIAMVCDLGLFIEKSTVEDMLFIKIRKNRRGVAGAVFQYVLKQPGGELINA